MLRMKNLEERIKPTELKEFFNKNGLEDINTSASLNIIGNLVLGRISQIIFDFGISTLHTLVEFLEEREEYEVLAMVRDKLTNHNKLTEDNFTLKDESKN